MNNTIPKVPTCARCNKKDGVRLRRQITASGVTQHLWYCLSCDHPAKTDSIFLAKATVIDWMEQGYLKISNLEEIPIARDYSSQYVCVVCSRPGAELHHWLPQAFFDLVENPYLWPTAYLCKECHDVWHELVTPYLPGRGKSILAEYTKDRYMTNNNY